MVEGIRRFPLNQVRTFGRRQYRTNTLCLRRRRTFQVLPEFAPNHFSALGRRSGPADAHANARTHTHTYARARARGVPRDTPFYLSGHGSEIDDLEGLR